MASSAREIAYHTYRSPRLSSACLNPLRVIFATPDEAMAEILAAIAPLPGRLEVTQPTLTTLQIFDPSARPDADRDGDPVVGVLVMRGLGMADIAASVLGLVSRDWRPPESVLPL